MSDANPNEGKPAGGAPEGDDPGKLRSTFEAQKAADDAEIARLKTANATIVALPGVDVTKPAVAAFISGYKGELTTEAIVKAAEEWDIKPGAAAPTGDEGKPGDPPDPKAAKPATGPTPEERAAAAAAAKVGGASTAPTGDEPDPYKTGTDAFNKALREDGKDPEAAFEAFLAPVIDAAARGNAAVIVPGGRVGGD